MMRRAALGLLLALSVLLFGGGVANSANAAASAVRPDAEITIIISGGDAAVGSYSPATKDRTVDALSDLYFDHFEGLEPVIGAVDAGLKNRLEAKFGLLIGKVRSGESTAAVAAAWRDLRAGLEPLPARLGGGGGFWVTFAEAFLIIVREGFEAMLVVTALAAYLRRAGAEDRVRIVYWGVAWAIGASLLTAWALSSLTAAAGAGQETVEGVTLLLAAIVLFYCSYWLFAKREAARWQSFVQSQIDQALARRGLYAIGFASFLAVYREGAETVLFYQALASGAPGQGGALLAGVAAGTAGLVAIFLAMRYLSLRLPLGLFFGGTAALLYYLAVDFAGEGVFELQNGRALSQTPLAGWPTAAWVGFHPTLEGALLQGILLLPLAGVLAWLAMRRRAAGARVTGSP